MYHIEIAKIIRKYRRKERNEWNERKERMLAPVSEKDLQRRYRATGNANFSFPEIKNALDCIADILSYYKDNRNTSNTKMRRLILQTIDSIKNASQETLCTDIKIDKCPPKNTISAITDARHKAFFNIKNENVIYRHGTQYCDANVYETPYKGITYPYAYCIRVMVQSLNVIDLLANAANANANANAATAATDLQGQFHYYLDYILDNAPNIFILPTLQSIGKKTLIQTRYSRIQPFGIHSVWEDINRIRRIYQNNVWYSKQHKISIDKLYAIMRKDTVQLFRAKYDERTTKLLYKIVIQDALPFTKDSIKGYRSNNCYPQERAFDNVETTNRYNRVVVRYYERGE
jgi:hypothetical protein